MITFIFSEKGKKRLEKFSLQEKNRIIEKLKSLKTSENIFFHLKSLANYKWASHRLRVWNLRVIIYMESSIKFVIVDIGNRGDIYK